jgi:3-oxoacyl-[acyl-carrier protein] reductase
VEDFMTELKDKYAIVTGGARGIGRAIADELARRGASIAVCDIDEAAAQKAAEELKAFGVQTLAARVNVAVAAEFEAFVDLVAKTWGRLDIMVNNAGITRDGLLMRMKDEDWQRVIDVNLTAVFYGCRAASKHMMRQKSGRIINIASVVGLMGNAGQANYSASKGGVIALTKTVARELASRGVTSNAVAPGYIETEMTANLPEKAKEAFLVNVPLGRPGKPQDVADAVAFFASDKAAYITGQVLPVDGGMVMY